MWEPMGPGRRGKALTRMMAWMFLAGTPAMGLQPPVPRIDADPAMGHAPLEVSFSAARSTDPEQDTMSFAWTFEAGASATSENVSYIFKTAGTYDVELTVVDQTGASAHRIKRIIVLEPEVNHPPVAYVGTTNTRGAAPFRIELQDLSTDEDLDPLTAKWLIFDAATDQLLVERVSSGFLEYVFDRPGDYWVQLVVTDSKGQSNTQEVPITVLTREPGGTDPLPSAEDGGEELPPPPQPPTLCGTGVLGSTFFSLMGLAAMGAGERRRRQPRPH